MTAVPCSRRPCGNTTTDPSGVCHTHRGLTTSVDLGKSSSVPVPMSSAPTLSRTFTSPTADLPTAPSGFAGNHELLERLRTGVEVNFTGVIDGVRVLYRIEKHGSTESLYEQTDNPVSVSIETSDGEDVFAVEYGGEDDFTFADGSTGSGFVTPVNADQDSMDSRISAREYEALVQAWEYADDAGFVSNVDEEGRLSAAGRAELVLDRVRAVAGRTY